MMIMFADKYYIQRLASERISCYHEKKDEKEERKSVNQKIIFEMNPEALPVINIKIH